MLRSCSGLVLIAVIRMIFGHADRYNMPMNLPRSPEDLGFYHPYQQMIPRYCWAAPRNIDVYKCCPVPRLYSDELLDRCGVEKIEDDGQARPKSPPKVPCKDGLCLMTNANLLKANGSVDYEKLRNYIDQWAEANPEFTDAILAAKKMCAKDGGPRGLPVCEQDRIFFCLNAYIIWNCKLRPLEGCDVLREHMDECRPFYEKPKDQEEKLF